LSDPVEIAAFSTDMRIRRFFGASSDEGALKAVHWIDRWYAL
jgi:hypothetical protein